jgi:tetratricopeptide (TPR) repeat protein
MTSAHDAAVADERLTRISLTGTPGSGRFAALVRWYHNLINRFPDGALCVRLGTRDEPNHDLGTAVHSALHALGVPHADIPASLEEKKAALLTKIAGRRMLIVVMGPVDEHQIEPFLPHAPGSAVVVIPSWQRSWLITKGFVQCTVERLADPHDIDLFRSMSDPVCDTLDADLITAALRGCDGVPRLITTVAAQITQEPWRATKLLRSFGALGINGLPSDEQRTVRAGLDTAYRSLPEDLSLTYRALGLHPGPELSAEAAAALWDTDIENAEALLARLVSAQRLTVLPDNRFRMDKPVWWHVQACAQHDFKATERRTIAERIATWYLDATVEHDAKLSKRPRVGSRYQPHVGQQLPGRAERTRALAWLEANREALVATVALAAKYTLDELVWQLCEALWGLLHPHCHHEDWRATHEIGLASARTLQHDAAIARMLSQFGALYLAVGELDRATECFTEARDLAARLSDFTGMQSTLEWLGKIEAVRSRAARDPADVQYHAQAALAFFNQSWAAVADAPADEHKRMYALLHLQRARLFVWLERYEDAEGELIPAFEYFSPRSEDDNKAKILQARGQALLGLGQLREAVVALERALQLFEIDGSQRSQLSVLRLVAKAADHLHDVALVAECAAKIRTLEVGLGLVAGT